MTNMSQLRNGSDRASKFRKNALGRDREPKVPWSGHRRHARGCTNPQAWVVPR